jgi:hypothetical protein
MSKISVDVEYRWPKSSDRLLRSSDNWHTAVTFTDQPVTRHVLIWSGYMHAGSTLIEACESEPGYRNQLVYPILFAYRHWD